LWTEIKKKLQAMNCNGYVGRNIKGSSYYGRTSLRARGADLLPIQRRANDVFETIIACSYRRDWTEFLVQFISFAGT